MIVHDCPSCNTYSRECIIVTQNDLELENEKLRCSVCSWSGTWVDMIVREIIDGYNSFTDYRVLHSDKTRIQAIGSCCPHCGGEDPLCWCQTF